MSTGLPCEGDRHERPAEQAGDGLTAQDRHLIDLARQLAALDTIAAVREASRRRTAGRHHRRADPLLGRSRGSRSQT